MTDQLITSVLSTALRLGCSDWNYSFDNRVLLNSDPAALKEIGTRLWKQLKDLQPQVLFGKGVAAYPLLCAIQLEALADGVSLKVLFIRDQRKTTGQFKRWVEGAEPETVKGARAVFVDDIYNRGDTHDACLAILADEGYELNQVGVGVFIDFWNASRQLRVRGIPFKFLLRRHDLGLTRDDRLVPDNLLSSPLWRLHVHHRGQNYMPVKSPPTIHEGRLYIGNDDTNFYCYDVKTGELLWMYKSAKPSLKGTVCVPQFYGSNVFWTAYDGTVRCANAETGKHVWAVKLDENLHSSPALDPAHDRMFVGTEWDKQPTWYGRGDFVALRMSNGHELWRVPTRGMIPSSPIYVPDANVVVCGNNDFHIYAFDADTGNILYQVPTRGEVKGKIAIFNGKCYAQTTKGYVYAFELSSGRLLWTRRVGESALHSVPVIFNGAEPVLCCTNQAQHVVGLNLNGDVKWVCRLRGSVGWGVTKISDGLAVAVTNSGYVVVIDIATGAKIAKGNLTKEVKNVGNPECWQPTAYDGQHLVIASNTRGIFCYEVSDAFSYGL